MESLKEFAERAFGVEEYDVVNNPKHYCSGAHECIDIMEELFGIQAVIDFCKCNIFKYRFRATQKNGDEDISKAEWYENKLIELNRKLRGESDDN